MKKYMMAGGAALAAVAVGVGVAFTTTSAPAEAAKPVTFTGHGNNRAAEHHLTDGTYKAVIRVKGNVSHGAYDDYEEQWHGSLGTDEGSLKEQMNRAHSLGETETGETIHTTVYVGTVKAGSYYVSAYGLASGADWTVKLVPAEGR